MVGEQDQPLSCRELVDLILQELHLRTLRGTEAADHVTGEVVDRIIRRVVSRIQADDAERLVVERKAIAALRHERRRRQGGTLAPGRRSTPSRESSTPNRNRWSRTPRCRNTPVRRS